MPGPNGHGPASRTAGRNFAASGGKVSMPLGPDRRLGKRAEDGSRWTEKTMFQTLSYQLYAATEQQACSVPAGHLAAGVRDLRIRLYRVFRPRHHVQPMR